MTTLCEERVTEGLAAFVEEWKDKPGNLIMVLHKAQEEYGYIPRAIAVLHTNRCIKTA